MFKKRKLTATAVLSLILLTGCSNETETKEELKPVEEQVDKEEVSEEDKLSNEILTKYKKSFGELKYSSLPNNRGIINVDNSREILGDNYATYITAYSLESSNKSKLNNTVIAEHSIHREDGFKEKDNNNRAIYNLLKSQTNTIFKDLNYREFIKYLNQCSDIRNFGDFVISGTNKEYIRLTREHSKITLTVCSVDSVDKPKSKYSLKNYSYDEFIELMYEGNISLINDIAVNLGLTIEQPSPISTDKTVTGYVPSFRLPTKELISIGIVDGQNAKDMRTFDIKFKANIEGKIGTKVDTVVKTFTSFLENKFNVTLNHDKLIDDAQTYEILNNFISELKDVAMIKSLVNVAKDNQSIIDYNPYTLDTVVRMNNEQFYFETVIPIKVDGKRTR